MLVLAGADERGFSDGDDDRSRRATSSSPRRRTSSRRSGTSRRSSSTWRWRSCGPTSGRWPVARRRSPGRRLPGIRDRRSVDPGRAILAWTRSRPSTTRAVTGAPVWPTGPGNFATSEIRCRYHAWRWELDGRQQRGRRPLRLPAHGRRRNPAQLTSGSVDGAVSCSSTWISTPSRLLDFLQPASDAARAVSLGAAAVPLVPHHDPPSQLEDRASTPSTRATTCRAPIPSC